MQALVSKVQVTGSQAKVPPENPRSVQLKPLRLLPSHCSPLSMVPLPHIPLPPVEVVVEGSVVDVEGSVVDVDGSVVEFVVESSVVELSVVLSDDPSAISRGTVVSVPASEPLPLDEVMKASVPSSGSPQALRAKARGTNRAIGSRRMAPGA